MTTVSRGQQTGPQEQAVNVRFQPTDTIQETDVQRAIQHIADQINSVPAATAAAIYYIIDGGGVALTPGVKGDLLIPFDCTITEWTITADQSGSMVIDVWSDTFGNYPPTIADSITGALPPTLTASPKGQSTNLTGWTTTLSTGNTLRFTIISTSTVQRATLTLTVARN